MTDRDRDLLLVAWPAAAPPAGFADRVLGACDAADAADAAANERRPARSLLVIGAGLGVAVLCVLMLGHPGAGRRAGDGERKSYAAASPMGTDLGVEHD